MKAATEFPLRRRAFLQTVAASTAILALRAIPLVRADDSGAGASIHIQSGESQLAPWTHHTHFLDVPLDSIQNPPADGISLETSVTLFHQHTVNLAQDELQAIAAGKSVTVTDTVGDHLYSISLHSIGVSTAGAAS